MKKFKVLFVLAIAISISNLVTAQHHPEMRARKGAPGFLKHLKSELNISAEQEVEIKTLQEKSAQELQVLRTQEFENEEQKRNALKNLRKKQHLALMDVLTEEQRTLLEEKRMERPRERPEINHEMDREKLQNALKSYRDEHIQPVLLEQRMKLESSLSAEDKTTLATLRKDRASKSLQKKEEQRVPLKERRHKKEMNEEAKQHKEKMHALVDKYNDEIELLFSEIEDKKIQWEEETKAIREQHLPKREEKTEFQHKRKDHPRAHFEKRREVFSKAHFLLLDPNETSALTTKNVELPQLEIYPNPSSSFSTINYKIANAGNVKIELRDEQGNLVKLLSNSRQEAGNYELNVNISSLKDGVYYYSITDVVGVTTKKLVVARK